MVPETETTCTPWSSKSSMPCSPCASRERREQFKSLQFARLPCAVKPFWYPYPVKPVWYPYPGDSQ
eukprot:1138848-Pelagomonas_calceolata.AAC.3